MSSRGIFFLFYILLHSNVIIAQEYKLSAEIGFEYCYMAGNSNNKNNDLETISLFRSYTNILGENLNLLYNLKSDMSAGISLDILQFRNWKNEPYQIYYGSSAEIYSGGPTVRFLLNKNTDNVRFRFCIDGSALAGKFTLDFPSTIYEVIGQDGNRYILDHEEGIVYGIKAAVSASRLFNPIFGLEIKTGIRFLHMNSFMCTDRNLFIISAGLGITFNTIQNKTFYIF